MTIRSFVVLVPLPQWAKKDNEISAGFIHIFLKSSFLLGFPRHKVLTGQKRGCPTARITKIGSILVPEKPDLELQMFQEKGEDFFDTNTSNLDFSADYRAHFWLFMFNLISIRVCYVRFPLVLFTCSTVEAIHIFN